MRSNQRKRQYPDNWSRCRECGAIYALGERHQCEEDEAPPTPDEQEDPELPASLAGANSEREPDGS